MARRRIADEPTSRLAIWARRCALFSLVATVLSIAIVRSGLLEIVPALATFAAALALAAVAILLALGAFVVIWRQGIDGGGYAVLALGIGAALLGYPAYLGVRAYQLPPINDIATDPADPPRFDVLAQLRPRGTVDYPGPAVAALQRRAYPDIETLTVSVAPPVAYDAALAVVTKRKWRVLDARAPQAGRRDGVIEAVARTAIMGFRDDIVLRIRADSEGSKIDIRSASRYGHHDIGGNAARIRSLLDDIDDTVSAISERQEQRRQRAVKPPAAKPAPARPAQPAR